MAVDSTLSQVAVRINLNNGLNAQGEIKTVPISLGSLDPESYDPQKAMNIINALENCLAKSVYSVQEIKIFELTE